MSNVIIYLITRTDTPENYVTTSIDKAVNLLDQVIRSGNFRSSDVPTNEEKLDLEHDLLRDFAQNKTGAMYAFKNTTVYIRSAYLNLDDKGNF